MWKLLAYRKGQKVGDLVFEADSQDVLYTQAYYHAQGLLDAGYAEWEFVAA